MVRGVQDVSGRTAYDGVHTLQRVFWTFPKELRFGQRSASEDGKQDGARAEPELQTRTVRTVFPGAQSRTGTVPELPLSLYRQGTAPFSESCEETQRKQFPYGTARTVLCMNSSRTKLNRSRPRKQSTTLV